MSSDIKLDGDWVVVEGKWARVRTWDLMLDAPARRKNNSGWRRALVHDPDDGLTINWGRDYPGGVKIMGDLSVESMTVGDEIKVKNKRFVHLTGNDPAAERFVLGDDKAPNAIVLQGRGLQINEALNVDGEAIFNKAIRTPDITIAAPPGPGPQPKPYSLLDRVQTLLDTVQPLEAEVRTLRTKVAALELPVSELSVSSGKQYKVMYGALEDGAPIYSDRDYSYANVPSFLRGATYILTANEDKFGKGNTFLSFSVNRDVTVYVAHDNHYQQKPSWLKNFQDTGEGLAIANLVDYSLFKKDYPAGKIVLGGNIAPGETGNYAMYTVILEPR